MPTTVRRRTCPASPATRPQNVAKPGAVKHGRSSYSRSSSEAGRFRDGSIGGFPRHKADNSTADASALSPPDHAPKPGKPPRVATTDRPRPPTRKNAKLQSWAATDQPVRQQAAK